MLALLFDDGGVRLLILLTIAFTGLVLAQQRSTYLVDFFLVVACFNRFLRRLLDWIDGRYDPQPLLSLTPVLLTGLMVLVVLSGASRLPKRRQRDAAMIAFALAMAMAMGVRNGTAAFYSLLNYLMPVATLFYPAVVRATPADMLRWVRLIVALGVVVAVYGIVQWVFAPPWDAAWLVWSGMTSSMGRPEPFKIGICSTLESRGPFAFFMAIAASLMCFSPKWRKPWDIPGMCLVVLAAVLSKSRSSWGYLVLSVLLFTSQQKGKRGRRSAVVAAVVTIAMVVVLPRLPGAEEVTARVQTLSDISSDGSFQGRTQIAQNGIWAVLRRPLGYGLGASGVGADKLGAGVVVEDNGYLALLVDLGIPGLLLCGISVYRIGTDIRKSGAGDPVANAALGLAGAGLALLCINNWVPGPYGAMVFLIVGSAMCVGTLPRNASLVERPLGPYGVISLSVQRTRVDQVDPK